MFTLMHMNHSINLFGILVCMVKQVFSCLQGKAFSLGFFSPVPTFINHVILQKHHDVGWKKWGFKKNVHSFYLPSGFWSFIFSLEMFSKLLFSTMKAKSIWVFILKEKWNPYINISLKELGFKKTHQIKRHEIKLWTRGRGALESATYKHKRISFYQFKA